MSGGGAKYSHHMTMPQFTPELVDEKKPQWLQFMQLFFCYGDFFLIFIMTALIH